MGILMRYYVWGGICDVVVSIKSYFLRHRTHLIPLSWIHPNLICFFVPLLRRDDKCERIKNFRWFFATTTLINFSFFFENALATLIRNSWSEGKSLLRLMALFEGASHRTYRLSGIYYFEQVLFVPSEQEEKFKFFFEILFKFLAH